QSRPARPRVISKMEIWKMDAGRTEFSRSLVLEAEFDGEQTLWCPVTDFFGMGAGAIRVKDYFRSCISGQSAISLWPMPYEKECRLTVHNFGTEEERLSIMLHIEDRVWDDRSMHFYSQWHFEYPIPTRPMRDWDFIHIEGKGVYVGDSLAIMNPCPTWWGEGDEKFYIDGESFPSHFGTGTEDYYGYAWCSNLPFEDPFHGQPRCDGYPHNSNWGNTTVSRVRALDCIPFTQSLNFDMEVWHWRDCEVAYAATTFFYARPGAEHNRTPQPDAAAAPLPEPSPLPPSFKIEGALECEAMLISRKSNDFPVEAQDMRGFARGKFSDEHQLFMQPGEEGDWIELLFPAADEKKQRITLYAAMSWDYGIIRFTVNDTPVGDRIDLFSGASGVVKPSGPIDLGVTEPVHGQIRLRVEVVGGNPASEGSRSFFGLDCIVLTPVDNE
ncbi:MAG: glycoside hydrolase family 172 protein, partial [Planctomycetota bacterium]